MKVWGTILLKMKYLKKEKNRTKPNTVFFQTSDFKVHRSWLELAKNWPGDEYVQLGNS